MSEQEKQENQKTIVAFAAGLLIGGLLVWIFGGAPHKDAEHKEEGEKQEKSEEMKKGEEGTKAEAISETVQEEADAKPVMQVGEGKVEVGEHFVGKMVKLGSATFPSDEGWVAVRDYADGKTGYILGAARFSKSQGLIPSEIPLVRSTVAGKEYALVFFGEDGDKKFNAMKDVQKEGVVGMFKAN